MAAVAAAAVAAAAVAAAAAAAAGRAACGHCRLPHTLLARRGGAAGGEGTCVRCLTGDGGGGEAPQHAEGCRPAIRAAEKALQHVEGLPPCDTGGGSASHGQQLRIFGSKADGAILLNPRRDQVSKNKSAGPRQRATALPYFPRFAIKESGDRIQLR